MPIFDTHTHYATAAFEADRDAVLCGLGAKGVGNVLECGTDYPSGIKCIELARKYPFMRAAVGLHPEETHTVEGVKEELAKLRPLYDSPFVAAVGEIGLDHHWDNPRDVQRYAFEEQCRLALELDMPVVVHDREAHAEVYEVLLRLRPKGVLHCYSGSAESAAALINAGFYFGFGGALTFKNAKRAVDAAAAIPPDRLLLETDCPYMAPVPCRGHRCDSSLLPHVVQVLAAIKGMEPERVISLTEENAKTLFGVW